MADGSITFGIIEGRDRATIGVGGRYTHGISTRIRFRRNHNIQKLSGGEASKLIDPLFLQRPISGITNATIVETPSPPLRQQDLLIEAKDGFGCRIICRGDSKFDRITRGYGTGARWKRQIMAWR